MPVRDIEPADALVALRTDPTIRILDVRTRPEFDLHHLVDAVLLPIQEIQERVQELDPDARWMVMCEHGMRSAATCEFLASLGFGELTNVVGGMARWVGEGLPLDTRGEGS